MEQVLTLVVRLDASEGQHKLLADTSNAFASACNWINETVGSLMIALLGLNVNQPRGSSLLACPIDLGLPKAPPSPEGGVVYL